ncbi:2,3-dihydro-2,3-dihydroxybenzoate dehydrogenase [Rhizomonospora bruguierae]|uniref:2,3-dihydro-2,3-dihydroxybenzoate dehydrogenase n=1 Tax=Rhizomonospora bruguierae TaxID=1581705 RepID=UPI001BCB3FE5|nr:2,3-dihydro-2,3-dihydroxybenzoate dehydrogenase [Micromonospora sp. NBRC 107566]
MEQGIAVVTGAAGGIGAAVASALGDQGVAVAAVDRESDRLATLVAKLGVNGARAEAFPTDVRDARSVTSMVDDVERRLGPVDYLVNCAGILRLGEARALSDEDWSDTFAVNVTGVRNVSRAVVDRMVPRRRGGIVTVASNAARVPRMRMAAYAASKAAAAMYTKCLGLEVARYGIRCNVVAPGSTDTPMLRSMWRDDGDRRETLEGRLDSYRVGIPLGKVATPAAIADAVAFLLSDRASHITLQDLTVDGGAALGV